MFNLPPINLGVVGTAIVAALLPVFGTCLVGCENANTVNDTLLILQQGKFAGEIVVTSDGRVSGAQTLSFSIGAQGTAITASGRVNFGDVTRVEDIVAPLASGGGDAASAEESGSPLAGEG